MNVAIKKTKKGDIVLDEYYNFERPIGYIPPCHITTEGEIRDICKKNKILIQKIIRYDTYRIIGKKVRMKKTYDRANAILINRK